MMLWNAKPCHPEHRHTCRACWNDVSHIFSGAWPYKFMPILHASESPGAGRREVAQGLELQ